MVVLKPIFEHTNVVSKYLQSVNIDLGAAVTSVNATLSVLKDYRSSTKFKELFESATLLAHKFHVEIPTVLSSRKRTVSRRLDVMWENEHHHETIEVKYRVEFYYEVLDSMIEQIEQRFSQETKNLLVSFSYIQPENLFKRGGAGGHECAENLKYLGEYYELSITALTAEYSLLKESSIDKLQTCTTALEVLQVMHQTGLHKVYCELYKLYRIFITLPITSASCERCFSKLTIVKNKLRSTMSQSRLENLMILFVENDITSDLTFDCVIDTFATIGPRRMQL